MGRRQARESAIQVLYQVDVGKMEVEEAFQYLQDNFTLSDADAKFARELVNKTLEQITELDKHIAELSRDWNLERMAVVDRNILRLALLEILYIDNIPNNVTVNEAVELAKKYSGQHSSKFINGILGAVVNKRKDS